MKPMARLLITAALCTTFAGAASAQAAEGPVVVTRASAVANVISGSTVAGRSCAGSMVTLTPATADARRHIEAAYGGGRILEPRFGDPYRPAVPQGVASARITQCDANGRFRFAAVPDGQYFVQSFIAWSEDGQLRGGTLLATASVRGGRTQELVLAP